MKLSDILSLLLMVTLFLGTKDLHASPASVHLIEQPVPKPIRKIVKEMAKANVFLLQKPVKSSPLINELEENYFLISKLATVQELEELIRTHKNAVVRMYAFKALTSQLHDIPARVMSVISNDSSGIECINGAKTENIKLKDLAQNFLN